MMLIPITKGFPNRLGTYEGEFCYDSLTNVMYIWADQNWNAMATQGPQGLQGENGKDADMDLISSTINVLDNTIKKLDITEKMTDLLAIGRLDKNTYKNLKMMLYSGDDETIKMALDTINGQHEKHIQL